jgi:hypothetical protein
VLDPRVQGRIDTSAYASALLQGINIELVHLGGVQRRRGLVQNLILPNELTLLAGTYTCPNGPSTLTGIGTNSQTNAFTTTTAPSTTNPWVLVHCDLGSAQNVLFADCLAIILGGGASTEFCIQWSNDNSTWATLGASFYQLDSTAEYTYRRTAGVTYPATYTNARYWRVAKVGGADLTSEVTFSDFVLWGDSGNYSASRLIPFEVSTTEPYALALTDRSGIVVYDGEVVDYLALPYKSVDLALLDGQSSAESLMAVHQSYAPQFVVRLSSPLAPAGGANASFYNFQTFLAEFAAIPQVDYADALSPAATSDLQTLDFNSGWNVGDTFTFTIQTDTTGPITYAGDNQTTANAIATAVQALWVVNGYTGVSCTSNGSYGYTLTFADAAAGDMGAIAITSLSSNATASATETQVGVSQQEDAWSATRGYPGTVTFFQGRMFFGGLRSQQETLLGSWVNDILNFDTAQGLDDQAIYTTLNGVALNAVTALFPGVSLCLFTSGGEFRFVNDNGQPITPTSIPTNQTQYGTAQIKPVMVDGQIVFVQRNGNVIRDFQFDYTQNQYNSLGISSFATNLIYDVQDIASWNGSEVEEMNYVFVCNGANNSVNLALENPLYDGTCAVYNSCKEASVQAWVVWETNGVFNNVCTVAQDIFFIVRRNLNGVWVVSLEQAVEGTYTDCGTGSVTQAPSSTVSGLSWLNGVECRAIADGYVLDNVTPVNGAVSLTLGGRPYTATTYEIGINFNPTVEPMPLQTVRWPAGSNLARKKRIVKMRIKVANTLGLLYNGEPLDTSTIDTFNFDTAPVPYSGILTLEDSTNWDETEDKTVVFTQVDPVPFYLMYLDVQLAGQQQ